MKNLVVKLLVCFAFISDLFGALGVSNGSLATGAPIGSNANMQRHIFNQLRKEYPTHNIAPGYLRVEQTLSNSTGTYNFNVKVTGNELATERKLDQNDVFVCTHIGFYLLNYVAATVGKQPLQSYANNTAFGATCTPELDGWYNGSMAIKINQTVSPEALPLNLFRYVPTTQQSAATNLAEASAITTSSFLGGLIYFRGNQSINVTTTSPTWAGIVWGTPTAGAVNLVFHPYGFLIKGAAAARIADGLR